ncbi:hypothetical protein AQI95_17820 [Streptomyces yokosukanensis]|uniref:Chaplin domain-containing protein n=1 Tax=Streptomyces yokosukanensis TaxID=67386 RepID=A0A124HFY9_9ACTN|nr:hypothetical protein [Streptomyces yokosukanensis]KUN05367.1 hypothetical protein AQI95_17820 [Streptomyces yokosukanensis]
MRKIIMTATLAMAAMAMAAPAHASTGPTPFSNWTFSPASVCGLEGAEVAALPILTNFVPIHSNSCSNGNVLDHPGI